MVAFLVQGYKKAVHRSGCEAWGMSAIDDPVDAGSEPVPVKFSPKEFMGLVEIAIETGYENVHDLVLDAADQMAEEKPPSNVVPFPGDEGKNHGQQDG